VFVHKGLEMSAGSPSTEPAASSDVDAVMEETDEALESGQEERSRGYLVCQSVLVQLLVSWVSSRPFLSNSFAIYF